MRGCLLDAPARRLTRDVPVGRVDDAREREAAAWAQRAPVRPSASAARGADVPLDPATRATMGRAFGFDFGQVRIHADAAAADEATALGARAYTVGHHIGFAAGAYRPDTVAGQRLIAHELAHVAQQAQGAPPQVQRDVDKAAPKDPVAEAMAEIAAVWQRTRAVAKGSSLAADWLTVGDAVVALIRTHATAGSAAIRAMDFAQSSLYTAALETDMVAFRYVVWHAFYYQNLDRISGRLAGLADAFRNDDRRFTGRTQAEDEVALMRKLLATAKQESPALLKAVRTDVSFTYAGVAVTVTSAGDTSVRASMDRETAAVKQLEASVELVVADINQFVATAHAEGLAQAVEAVEEFYQVKSVLRGPSAKPGKDDKTETKPDLQPVPLAPPAPQPDDKKKTCATEYPSALACSSLPAEYVYKSAAGALNEMKRVENNQNLSLHNPSPATSGPCPGTGTHYNVRDGNRRVGSIGCCPCCTDTAAGPSMATRCRIIW